MTRFAKLAALSAGCALALTAGSTLAAEPSEEEYASEGEKELAEMLEGRVAGEPKRCINTFSNKRLRVIDGTALVYGRGNTIWVNTTKHPEDIDDDDVLVIRRHGSQLCRLDNVTTIDRFSGFFSGVVFLDDFVPYTRAEKDDSGDS